MTLAPKALRTLDMASKFNQQVHACMRPDDDEHYERLMFMLQYTSAMKRMFEAYDRGDLSQAEHEFRCATQVFEQMRVAREHWIIKGM